MRSGKKTSSDGPGLIEAFRARIRADSIKIHSNGGKHRQTGTHNAMGASAKGNVKIHIETQYPNSNDNPSRPNNGTEIDGDSAEISARTTNKPHPSKNNPKRFEVNVKDDVKILIRRLKR